MKDSSKMALIRCRQLKTSLKIIDEMEKDIKVRVLKLISKDIISEIEKTDDSKWLPVAYNINIVEAFSQVIGDKGVYDSGLKGFFYSLDSSMIGPFFKSAINLLKIKPTALWKMSSLTWSSVFKNCGNLRISERDSTCVNIILENLSSEILNSKPYLLALAGSFHAVLIIGKVEGQVVLERYSVTDRKATFIASWKRHNLYKENVAH